MRFMIFVKATKTSETGAMPGKELIEAMGKYNQQLIAAGIMKDGGGLHPSSKGARIIFSGKERRVSMGPFSNTSELVSGYWTWNCTSLDQAISWVTMWQMIGVLAELERSLIAERTRASVKMAQKRGVRFGRKPKLTGSQLTHALRLIEHGEPPAAVAKSFSIGRSARTPRAL